jgi:DNA-binding MarR family transcriptional regulator
MNHFEDLERLLRKLSGWVRTEGRKVLKSGDYQLTPAQFDILQKCYFHQDMTMTQLSIDLGVAKSTVTGIVTKLREAKYLDYGVSEEDKRVRNLTITDKGKTLIREVIEARVQFIEELFSQVDPILLSEFHQVLRIIANTLDTYRTDS